MNIKEAYKTMQAECGIDIGDTVKVLRSFKHNEMGYSGCPLDATGVTGTVTGSQGKDGIRVTFDKEHDDYGTWHWFPFFVLKLIEKKKDENMITVKGKEYSESTLHKAIQEYSK